MVLPPSTWKTARTFCHLPFESKLDKGLLNKANELLQSGQYEAAWTGTRINYSRWIAFIGKIQSTGFANFKLLQSLSRLSELKEENTDFVRNVSIPYEKRYIGV